MLAFPNDVAREVHLARGRSVRLLGVPGRTHEDSLVGELDVVPGLGRPTAGDSVGHDSGADTDSDDAGRSAEIVLP